MNLNISKGTKMPDAIKVVLYGVEGIGKSTFASHFPNPIFIDTEGSTKYLNVDRLDRPNSWAMLITEVKYIRDNPSMYKTLVVDTADWAEKLCVDSVCASRNMKSIEDANYGRGYTYLYEEFGKFLNILGEVADRGINVVITAHAIMRKFEQPDELGAYDRWELKLSKKVAPMVKEWADMVLFFNYRTDVVRDSDTKKTKARSFTRMAYASHNACWDAKNRQGLPDEFPMDFSQIAHVIPGLTAASAPAPQAPRIDPELAAMAEELGRDDGEVILEDDPDGFPPPIVCPENASAPVKKLYDILRAEGIYPEEVESAVITKGYFPAGMTITDYPPDFVEQVLVGAWGAVKEMIMANRP